MSETHPTAPCEMLPWDTEFFRFPIAKLHPESLASSRSPSSWQVVDRWCADHNVRCLYCIIAPDFGMTRLLESVGANLVDVKMMYAWTAARSARSPILTTPTPRVREAHDQDMPALEDIAGRVHRGRFHNDGRFPRDKCDELYRIWIRKGRYEMKNHVLFAEDGGVALGYCACARSVENGEAVGKVEIIGVDERARGKGVGRELVAAALRWFVDNGMQTVRLVTEASNLAAQPLYQRFGFTTTDCQFSYHKWFDR
jgi:ribosomal protein S18 acetylase RimI-like enzyme